MLLTALAPPHASPHYEVPVEVGVEERRWHDLSAADWDAFAQRCGASHRCALGHVRFWRLRYRLRFFELYAVVDGGRQKIGQCAIAYGRGSDRQFVDSLQLLPVFDEYWSAAMRAVLRVVGPGQYRYGSTWSLESPRDGDFYDVAGVSVESIRQIVVEAVDFSRWSSWDAYLRDVSTNARRNAKRASQSFPDLAVTVHPGMKAATQVALLTRLRLQMFKRKELQFRVAREYLRSLFRSVLWRHHAFIATASGGGQTLSLFSGICFGSNTYYLEGASRVSNGGATWHLMLAMLREAFERAPTGKFVMGITEKDADLARSRQQCRVTGHETSVVSFSYTDPGMTACKLSRRSEVPIIADAVEPR